MRLQTTSKQLTKRAKRLFRKTALFGKTRPGQGLEHRGRLSTGGKEGNKSVGQQEAHLHPLQRANCLRKVTPEWLDWGKRGCKAPAGKMVWRSGFCPLALAAPHAATQNPKLSMQRTAGGKQWSVSTLSVAQKLERRLADFCESSWAAANKGREKSLASRLW